MREIRQSGSEGGAAMNRPYPYRPPYRALYCVELYLDTL